MNSEFTKDELHRYSRHILLSEIGEAGQLKIKNAKVLVIGAGGLGVPVLQYLTAAGVGIIGIADGDVVDLSNLQRQVLYDHSEVGSMKSEVAKQKLVKLNPEIEIISIPEFLTPENAITILSDYDILVDGSDNFPTRYLVNDACVKLNKPFVSGAIFRFSGQVGVFNYNGSATYRCLFPLPPSPEDQTSCNELGVLGVVPGLIGTMQANEVLKMVTGAGDVLANKLLAVDFLSMKFQTFTVKKDEGAVKEIFAKPLMNTEAYQRFCLGQEVFNEVKSISPFQLRQMLEHKEDFQLIDVRGEFERDEETIGGHFIPYPDVMSHVSEIETEKKVVLYCKVGLRSHIIIQRLQEKFGMKNLYNLKGGIKSYLMD